ncbi:MAG TPA: dihydrodipicolinate synthase family protein [Anaerovoracaceae bacterium]|nr:dihydrodipicolinate synthase family protein [Anaerovoracaceae bacterium]
MIDLSGLYPPIVTAFDDNENIAYDKLQLNLQHWVSQPLDGVVMPGSNSEAAFMTEDEHISIMKVCADSLKGTNKRLIAGTGMETTAGTIKMTQIAGRLGAAAALILPPHFFKASMKHDVLISHYYAVADESPIPILVYNVPAFTGVDITLETMIALANHPMIIGAKDSSANVVKMAHVLAAVPDFQVFAGTGSALLPFLSIGGCGGVMALANFAAKPLRQLYEAFNNGNMKEATRIQLSLAHINAAVTSQYGVSGLKYAMDRSGFYGGPTRRPLLALGESDRRKIDQLLINLDL